MKSFTIYLSLFYIAINFSSCIGDKCRGITPLFYDTPENLIEINSEYDDYNSDAPPGDMGPFCFSSNRNSKGGNFDIVYDYIHISLNCETGKSNIGHPSRTYDDTYRNQNIIDGLKILNTEADEFGPFLIPMGSRHTQENIYYNSYMILYSSNEEGNQDIRYVQNADSQLYSNPIALDFLNSDKDDCYPSIFSPYLFFCSNRDGNFDIYRVNLIKGQNLYQNLTDTTKKIVLKEDILNSPYDDKCPFILHNLLVFASNRPGGYGGYDLYYSVIKDGQFTAPQNFGEKINSEYDEYRPFPKTVHGFKNALMIFSSNRPGGKGGFDLYSVGIRSDMIY